MNLIAGLSNKNSVFFQEVYRLIGVLLFTAEDVDGT